MTDSLFWTLFVGVVVAVIATVIGIGIGASYYAACRQAEMFNQINGTEWTCSDFFWAGEQINSQTITVRK